MEDRNEVTEAAASGEIRHRSEGRAGEQEPQSRYQVTRLVNGVVPEHVCASVVKRREGLNTKRRCVANLPDAVECEEQVLRIDVLRLYEAARLLGTPTGVRRVYEATLLVHEVVQISARPNKSLTKVLAADLEEFSSDGVGHVEDLAEDIDHALFPVEAEQHARRAREPGFVHEQAQLDRDAAPVGQV